MFDHFELVFINILQIDHKHIQMVSTIKISETVPIIVVGINDCISITTDSFNDFNDESERSTVTELTATSGPYDVNSTVSSTPSSFEYLLYNDTVAPNTDRNKILLAACYSVIEGFGMIIEPYTSQKKKIFPTQKILKNELICRVPTTQPKVLC